MKNILKKEKVMMNFFKSYPSYNGFVHATIGIGAGILLAYPLAQEHPVWWGVIILVFGLLLHLYPLVNK